MFWDKTYLLQINNLNKTYFVGKSRTQAFYVDRRVFGHAVVITVRTNL